MLPDWQHSSSDFHNTAFDQYRTNLENRRHGFSQNGVIQVTHLEKTIK